MGTATRYVWWGAARRIGAALLIVVALAAPVSAVAVGAEGSENHLTPSSGPTAGGMAVTITGQHLTGATRVQFGSAAATGVTVVSDTQITATTPAHGPGPAPVYVLFGNTNPATATNGAIFVGQFIFTGTVTLAITRIEPSTGPTGGQQPFAIIGTGFAPSATVMLGDVAATDVHLLAEGVLIGRTPANAAGPVNVTVKNPGGASVTQTGGYTYVAPTPGAAPTITRLDPSQGPATDGTTPSASDDDNASDEHHGTVVAIVGANFQQGATVTFGGVASTRVYFMGPTALFALAPPHAAGVVDVTVTNPDAQSATRGGGFTYVAVQAAPLTIREIAPSSGPTGASEARLVKIEGTGFRQGATVTFGGVPATHVTVISGSIIAANAPDHAPGAVDVVVTNPDTQSATKADGYTYFTPIRITSVSPTSGPAAGGTVVTITGTNFQQGATVAFGEDAATGVIVSNDGTSITATTPAHHPGVATIVVTNPDHHRGYLPASFAFTGSDENPTTTLAVQRVESPVGPIAGGMHIIVRGTGFAAGMTVTIGGAAATGVQVLNSTTITAVTPAHAAGQVAVAVSDSNGSHSATLANAYTYLASTNDRHTWEDPTDPQGGAPANRPTNNRPGNGAGSTAGTAVTTGTTPAPAPAPTGR